MGRTRGLYKRGKVWWIRYAGPDGQMRYESARTSSLKDAAALLAIRKAAVAEGKDPLPIRRIGTHTFRELAGRYAVWAQRQRSFRTKRTFIGELLEEFGAIHLRRFNTMLVEEWQTRKMALVKPSTVNRLLATLKHMFTKAVEWEFVEEDVLKRVRRVKLLPENNRRLRYLSRDESAALIDVCSPHLRPIVVVALNTGMRKEEILSLEWDRHIDLQHGMILLDRTKNGERREIPMNAVAREAFRGVVRRLDCPYVFHQDGRRFRDLKRSFGSALRKVGIKDFHFHDLRHTFASQLVMAGADITTVKDLLGHKSLSMTLRYAHLAPEHRSRAVDLLVGKLMPAANNTKTIQ